MSNPQRTKALGSDAGLATASAHDDDLGLTILKLGKALPKNQTDTRAAHRPTRNPSTPRNPSSKCFIHVNHVAQQIGAFPIQPGHIRQSWVVPGWILRPRPSENPGAVHHHPGPRGLGPPPGTMSLITLCRALCAPQSALEVAGVAVFGVDWPVKVAHGIKGSELPL